MDIEQALLKEHSKQQTLRIIHYIGDDQQRFDVLVKIFLTGEYRLCQRASWPLSYCVQQHPHLIRKHLKKIIRNLDKPVHDAVKRNTIRLLRDLSEIPETLCGEIADKCFAYLRSMDEPAAIKAFSMRVLLKICRQYPEIKNELKLIIEDMIPYGQPAIKSTGRDVLKQLERI